SATAPAQNIVPVSGIEVPGSGGTGTVGINIFNGLGGTLASLPNGAYIRTTFHLEGKLLDGTTVHTAEREYLFQVCTVTGCGLGSPWSATVGTPPAGGGALPECNGTNAPCIGTCF